MTDLEEIFRERILNEIHEERERQIELGWTPEHDDKHDRDEWADLIRKRVWDLDTRHAIPERDILVVIAALAVAGIERLDRGGS